jgi:acetyltransferase-like isoleucine patch superfamily enzyme
MNLPRKIVQRWRTLLNERRREKFLRYLQRHYVQIRGCPSISGTVPPLISNHGIIELDDAVIFNSPVHPVELFVCEKATLRIGRDSFINQGTTIACSQRIDIGERCLIGEFVAIHDTHFHAISPTQPTKTAPVRIGYNVWIGHRATILPGVTIGDHAVIGAGAVVTKDVPAKTIVADNPAKPVRTFECPDDWRRP